MHIRTHVKLYAHFKKNQLWYERTCLLAKCLGDICRENQFMKVLVETTDQSCDGFITSGHYQEGSKSRSWAFGESPLHGPPTAFVACFLASYEMNSSLLSYNVVLGLLKQAWAWVEPSAPVSLNKSSLPNCLCQGFGNSHSNQMQDLMYSLVTLQHIIIYKFLKFFHWEDSSLSTPYIEIWSLRWQINYLDCGVFPKYIFQNFILNTLNIPISQL